MLDVSYNALTGLVPPEWGMPGALPALQRLDLSQNVLSGALPDTFGSMATLQWLDLSENALSECSRRAMMHDDAAGAG